MDEDNRVQLDYNIYGTLPDGWYVPHGDLRPIKGKPSMTAHKESRVTPSQKQAEFASRFNAHFETKATDSDPNK